MCAFVNCLGCMYFTCAQNLSLMWHLVSSYCSSPDIWFDDVDISEINGQVATPPAKKPREDTKSTTMQLVTGKCTE